ncbi:hypothetical protein PQ465_04360 [Sphingobacterium oryzagri]|uniref:DUF1700 domain-containing protein n=1 Tax=Sphingobacterium oryzagri TaxID=3025669 RepID=A0ABY7WKV6_9SPHI|nr:hypothetical protein [Sphingobacterium sp. KACC 22765]WDF69615.1 hypothetical protein PQ465_04360 [Sphingobacterium sp. KACC 22765]
MTFKKIQFSDSNAQKIYENYLKQIESATKVLSKEDRNDILAEISSHIYESLIARSNETSELVSLIDTLERLGVPNEVLKPLIAEKKLLQATKTFNPIHVFKALILNLSNGLIYTVFFFLYIFLFSFLALIFGKLLFPKNTGLFYQDGKLVNYGILENGPEMQQYEILGYWLIPFNFVLMIIFYLIITFLLKLKRTISYKLSKK